ncbi:hypothetical protein Goari_004112, partial [Gossypium aridum]|nr:hypothetical protein [Gossypium aridum]
MMERERWKPPENPFMKINFDAAYKKDDNRSCSGIVIKKGVMAVEVKGDALSVIKNLQKGGDESRKFVLSLKTVNGEGGKKSIEDHNSLMLVVSICNLRELKSFRKDKRVMA